MPLRSKLTSRIALDTEVKQALNTCGKRHETDERTSYAEGARTTSVIKGESSRCFEVNFPADSGVCCF